MPRVDLAAALDEAGHHTPAGQGASAAGAPRDDGESPYIVIPRYASN